MKATPFAAGSGTAMITAALIGPHTPALLAVGALGLALALVGLRRRRAAIAAVAVAIVLLTFGDPSALAAVVAGLAATMYLAAVHAIGAPPDVAIVDPSVAGAAASFAVVALVATAVPMGFAWLPLLAPVTIALLYTTVLQPLKQNQGGGVGRLVTGRSHDVWPPLGE